MRGWESLARAAGSVAAPLPVSTGGARLEAAIPAAERQALIDLYTSSNGPGWTTSTNRLGAAGTECTWHGLTCDGAETSVEMLILAVSDPATRPALHRDATVGETLSTGETKTWKMDIGNSFTDAPPGSFGYRFIKALLHSGITAGCGGGNYCPADLLTRAQMAVFLTKAFELNLCGP